MNCDSELCGAGLRDGPAGGVDAIQLANAREARVGHGLVIGERGFLVVGVVADVLFFGGQRVVETARGFDQSTEESEEI